MIKVEKYTPLFKESWDSFIKSAKNATFLFERAFMDYHQDRFFDHSLIVFKDGNLVAILPANHVGKVIWSHQGLSYGGLVLEKDAKLPDVLQYFESIIEYLKSNGFEKWIYKSLPAFYQSEPAFEEEYALFRFKAERIRVEVNSLVDLTKPISFAKDRKRMVQVGINNGLKVVEEHEFDLFWSEILVPTRWETHKVIPAHSFQEIQLLAQFFPLNIAHFNVYKESELISGATVFIAGQVVHTQYIASSSLGKKLGAADFLIDFLIQKYAKDFKTLSFGISTDTQGQRLNEGLLYWKNGFGATVFPHYTYILDLV